MDIITHDFVRGDLDKVITKLQDKSLFGKIQNPDKKGRFEVIPVDKVRPIEAQRETDLNWAYNRLVERNGLDFSVFEPISVFEGDDGFYYCDDGLGRLTMHQLAGLPTIDAWVSQGNQKEASSRFSYKNKYGRRSVDPEAVFNADVESGDETALNEVEALKYVGLSVKVRSNKVIPDNSSDPQIKISAFRKALKFANSDLEVLKMARDSIVSSYSADPIIRADFFVGMTIVFHTYDILKKPGAPYLQLQNFLDNQAAGLDQSRLPFKKNGGNQHNLENESVAYGIVKGFTGSKFCTNETAKSVRHKILLEKYGLQTVVA